MTTPVERIKIAQGITFSLRFDPNANVFVGTSPEVAGLVVEAPTRGLAIEEARILLPDLR